MGATKNALEHVLGRCAAGVFPMQVNGGVGGLAIGAWVVSIKAGEEFIRGVEVRAEGVVRAVLEMGKDDAAAILHIEREVWRHFTAKKDAFV